MKNIKKKLLLYEILKKSTLAICSKNIPCGHEDFT